MVHSCLHQAVTPSVFPKFPPSISDLSPFSLRNKPSHMVNPMDPNGAGETLDLIKQSLSILLLSCLSVKSFLGRFQVIHCKLLSLNSLLSSLSDSPHWSDNSLLQTLLPSLLSTLLSLRSLSSSCLSPSPPSSKLLLQSDLDISSSSLSDHLSHLDLLLRSGVLSHSSALVLSLPSPTSHKDDLSFYIRDLFTRLQIGGPAFKEDALRSLVLLLNDHHKASFLVAAEGNVRYLIQLLDFAVHPPLRDLAVSAVSVLSSAGDHPRKAVFEEGGLGPLLRVLESGSSSLKDRASMAIESLTADPENSWALSAYGGVSVLVEACRGGSLNTQAYAAGAIKNAAVVEDVRAALVEENALPVLLQLLVSGNSAGQEKAAGCLSILAASSEMLCASIVQERGLQRLVQLVNDSTHFETLEHGLRAIRALSSNSDLIARSLASSTMFVVRLAELIVHGNVTVQQISAVLLGSLLISDGNKRAAAATGCMTHLVKVMEMPKPGGMQEAASTALVSLLSVRSNRKELARDEKSVMRLVKMMDVGNEAVCKQYPVAVVAALLGGGGNGCRKRLVAAGMQVTLQRLSETEVAGAKKALHRLSGNRFKSIFSRTWRE